MIGEPISLAEARAARLDPSPTPADHAGPNTRARAEILTRMLLRRDRPLPEETLLRLVTAFLTMERMEALGIYEVEREPTPEEIERAYREANLIDEGSPA